MAAREALAKALEIYPGNRDAQALMGEALVALGRGAEARPFFDGAYEGGSGPADEDEATRKARAIAEAGGAGAPPPDPAQAIREALDDAVGPRGPRRDAAIARLRAAAGSEAEVLHGILDDSVRVALDSSRPSVDRVRALTVMAAAGDSRLAEAVLVTATSKDPALATAAVDAAAEGGASVLAPLLDPAKVNSAAIRARAVDRLAVRKEKRAVELCLDALGDPDQGVRTSALAALFQLTGKKEFDPGAPEEERAVAITALREWWSGTSTQWK
jgi:HEAT repeat protein